MGDGERPLSGSSSTPKSGWSFAVLPSPQTADCWPSDSWLMPWALATSPRTISRKAVLAVTSDIIRSRCSGSPFTVVWLVRMTPTMVKVFPETLPRKSSLAGKAQTGTPPAPTPRAASRKCSRRCWTASAGSVQHQSRGFPWTNGETGGWSRGRWAPGRVHTE